MPDFVSMITASAALAVSSILFSTSCFLILMLILRPFWCWYFKINDVTFLLTEIRDILYSQQNSETSEMKYSPSSHEDQGNAAPLSEVKIKNEGESNSRLEAEIKPKAKSPKTENKSFWNVDKPMLVPSDKRWQPPENKK